jgi:hypothetical protein
MPGGFIKNAPLERIDQRLEILRRGIKVSTSNTISIGVNSPSINIDISGQIGLNVATPNTGYIITFKNNEQIGWQNSSNFLSRTSARDAGARIFKSNDNNLYIDNLDANIVFRRGGLGASLSNTIFINGSTGFIGFNNSSPEAVVHIGSGSLLLENNRQIFFKNSTGANRTALSVNTANFLLLTAPDQLVLRAGSDTSTVEGLRVNTDGKIAISGGGSNFRALAELHIGGSSMIAGVPFRILTPASYITTATISATDLINGVININSTTAVTLTFPTGTVIDGSLPTDSPIGLSFEVHIVNPGNATHSLTAPASGVTFRPPLVASMTPNSARIYLFNRTGANQFDAFLKANT